MKKIRTMKTHHVQISINFYEFFSKKYRFQHSNKGAKGTLLICKINSLYFRILIIGQIIPVNDSQNKEQKNIIIVLKY